MKESNYSLPAEGFVRKDQLLKLLPVSPATLRRMIEDGSFPPPCLIYKRVVAWPVSTVRNWLAANGGAAI